MLFSLLFNKILIIDMCSDLFAVGRRALKQRHAEGSADGATAPGILQPGGGIQQPSFVKK